VSYEDILSDRRRALEEAFFRKQDHEVLARLRADAQGRSPDERITTATGVKDEAIVKKLAGLGFDAETLLAFAVVPLVEVAWADGTVDDAERRVILSHSHGTDVPEGSPAHALVMCWLERRPPESLFEAWVAYTRELCSKMNPADREWLAAGMLRRANAVASASGGLLGLVLTTSKVEGEVLRKIQDAFRPAAA
jgi:hypothetical protein